MKKLTKFFLLLCGLSFFSFFKTYSCDQTTINILSAVDNGNGTYTYTVQICLGISPNWGATGSITLDANVPILTSGFTSSVSTTYTYCDQPLSCNGANCVTGNVMGCPPANGSMTTTTVTASGSVSGGNLTYNPSGGNLLCPGDIFAPSGDCGDCGNGSALCFNVVFMTSSPLTSVQLNGAEQVNNNCGAGNTCCPNEIDNTPPPLQTCTPPTAGIGPQSTKCVGSAFNFTNTGTSSGVTWSWTFPSGTPATSTSQNPSGVTWSAAGTYTVTETVCLTANPTCCSSTSKTITVSSPPTLTNTSVNETCSGQCNGSIDLSVSGGTTPYSYSWSNGTTTQDLTGLCAGTYTVTVSDIGGCTSTKSVTIVAGLVVNCGFTVSGSTCLSGNSLSFTNTGTSGGGTTYAWTFPSGTPATSTSQSPAGVTWAAAGTYTITQTVTKSGCSTTCTQTITVNPNPTVSFTPTNETCAGLCNGAATAAGAGGTTAYTYSWSGGLGSGATKSGLCAGTYTVTVTDSKGCTGTGTVTINPGPVVTSTFTTSANQCLTGNSFNFTNTGSAGTYSWTFPSGTPASSTLNNVTGVTWAAAGTYTITHSVTSGGCTSTTTQTITVFPQPSVSITPVNPTCNGTCTGSLTATGSGGTSGYTYSWSGGLGAGATKSSVCAGTYTVTITDANSCTNTATVTLTAPPLLTVTATPVNITCNGTCNGTLTASASGGTTAYTYSWSGGLGAGATKSSVCAGTYTVTVTDSKGCTATATATVNQPTLLTASATATNATCNGTCNGTLTASGSGGTTNYSYAWSGGLGSGATKSSVCAGTYTVTITDANGCTATASATVSQPPALTVSPTATNVTCNGACNGTVSASASGGTTAYTYSWSGGLGAGPTKTSVCAGTYTVTVTDNNGCTVTGTATVTQPAALTLSATSTNATCNGTCNGTLTASASGGTTNYSYAWSGGLGAGATKSGVCAGTYTVTVTDANGCTKTATATVTEPSAMTLVTSAVNATCGNANGSCTVTASGGTTPYSYLWNNGQTNSTATGLAAGSYTVTVTDAGGCTKTATVSVNNIGSPVVSIINVVNVSCNGGNNGSAQASVTGGVSPYSYLWSPSGGTGASASGLSAITYTVSVTDFNNCVATATVTITQPPALTASISSTTNTSCNGVCDGSATVTASGGVTAYSYFWQGGGTSATKTGLCAGTFTVTVSDSKGCATTTTATITQPPVLTASIAGTNVSCNGTCNGAINLTPTGGTSPYTYNWSNSANSEDLSSVCAGTYTVTVTDVKGCTTTASVTITQPTALATTTSSVNSTCGNSNGQACVSASGGTTAYTYSWNTTPSQITTCATGVAAGNYTVTITDSKGCTKTATVTVSNSSGGTATATVVSNATGAGLCNGSASASMTGGTLPYTYLWGNGQTSPTATGLCAGVMCVTVTDANNCSSSACITITQPPPIVLTTVVTNVTCNGVCNGSIDLTVTGGVSPYTYNWSSGATAQDPANLCAGNYTVTVTDANNVQATTSATVTQPTALSLTGTTTNLSCNGVCNGAINITVSGGTSPYSYLWSSGSSSQNISSLCAGSFTVTVTDANGCTKTSTFNITQPPALVLSTSAINASCGTSNGSASVTVSGGTSPYTYNWSAGSTGATQSSVAAGSYTVTVTDNKGCTATATVSVGNNSTGTASATVVNNVFCLGGNNGSANASITGGQSPFTYLWSTTPSQSGTTATGLSAGTFTVSITDNNNCIVTANVTITQPTALTAAATAAAAACNGVCNGTLTGNATGGTSPYSFSWSGGLGSGATKSGVCAGTYNVTATDANGCTATASVTVNQPTAVIPTTATLNSHCGQADGQASVTVTGGNSPYTYLWSNTGNSTSSTVTGISAGTYTVTVTDASNCTATVTATVNDNAAPTATASITAAISCNGTCNGSATLTINGGTTPYTYLWSNSSALTTATGLCAGTASVNITDATGCVAAATVTLNQPTAVTATATATATLCNGICNGTLSASASGGTSPYSFSWSGGLGSGATKSNVCTGTYTVTATDANGCTSTASATVLQPTTLAASATSTNVSCNGACNGTASASSTGGTTPYTFLWSGGLGSNSTVNNVCAGTYTVTVSDASGCSSTATATVTQPAALTSSANGTNISCNGICNGTVSASASGGTLGYSFSWNGGLGAGANHNSVCAGAYSVTVTDADGCTTVSSATVTQPASLTNSVSQTNVSCYGNCDGSATATVSGGNSPYSYLWNDANFQTTSAATSLCAGAYSVTVTDSNGCTITGSATITQPAQLVLGSSTNGSTCNQSDGSATVSIVSGISPYTYQWAANANNQTTATATGLAAGCYDVTVTQSNGCTATENICVNDLGAPVVSLLSQTNATCFGSCNGFAQIAVSGGNPPYNYSWNTTPVQTTASAFNLCAGTYMGSMVDATGCAGSISVTITQPTIVSGIISSVTDVSCFGSCNGQATITGTGGNSPYAYQWNDVNSQTTATATGLCPGTYNVIISDVNSCDTTISVTINEPPAISLAINTTNAFCGTASGQACVTVTNGVSPFTYQWNNSQTTQCAGNLIPGNYSLTVTDFKGCTATTSATVNNTAPGTAGISNLIDVSCNGICDGSATVSMSGSGTTPYSYLWSNGSASLTASGLCAGTISVTVTDANNCASNATATINSPAVLSATTSATNAICNGICNSSATLTVNGGTSPYTYLWNDVLAQTTATATGLCAGNYSVTVTDSKGCTLTQSVTITQPTAMQLTSTVFDAHCGQPDGSACVVVSGGTSTYTYQWSSGQTNQCLNNVVAGAYNITVTDANGCTGTLGVNIQNLNGPTVSVSSTINASCNGVCNGSATIGISGGAGSYIISWFDNIGNPIFQTNPTASNLCAGNYSAVVTDSAGCTASASVTITQPAAITYSQSTVNPTCSGNCSGSATVAVTGGTSPYTYGWNTTPPQSTSTATALCAGSYVLTIADSNSCTVFVNYTLNNPSVMTATTSVVPTTCSGVCNGSATVTSFNGNAPFIYLWDAGTGNQSTQTAINLCGGTFNVTVTDASGCTATTTATVGQPQSVNAIISTFGNVSCNGGCNGFAQVSISGGTPGYIFNWSNGQINQVASNLCAGILIVTVTDVNGCTDIAQVTIAQPQAIGVVVNKNNVSCNGNCDGSAILNVSGGTPSYTYLWSASANFQNTITATGLCAGTHSVTITDANGCTKITSVVIIQPTPFNLVVNSTSSTNCGQSNGIICVTTTGGTAPYSYQWNDPYTQTSSCADSLFAGCYYVNITDAAGCTADSTICINDIPSPNIVLGSVINDSCNGEANGIIIFNVSGGTTPYSSITWQNGIGNPIPSDSGLTFADSLSGGSYSIIVTDAAGCTGTASQSVTEPNPVVAAITSTVQNSCFGQCVGQATVSAAGGTSPYSYSWNNSQTSATATGLCAGTYSVLVNDNNSCPKTVSVTISQPSQLTLTPVITNVSCNGICDGAITVNTSGGTVPYLYSWSPNSSVNPSSFNLCAGSYNTSVTDANGCISSTNNTITQPVALATTYTTVDATCGSCNGSAALTVNGGTNPYSYLWINGQNSTPATGLCAGINPVTVTDANGCNVNVSVNLLNQGGPQITGIVSTPPTCYESGNGTAEVSITGGTPTYSFLWSDPLHQDSSFANSLGAGNFCVTVTDANGCNAVQCTNITDPPKVLAIGYGADTICYGQSTQIWTTGSGGTGNYSYQWANLSFFGSGPHTVNPTQTTDYCFTVYDDFGCSDSGCITITVKQQLALALSNDTNICIGDSTNLCAIAAGGDGVPYTYTWSNNFIDSIATPSCQQVNPVDTTTYTVIASDGCSLNDTSWVTVFVNQYPNANISINGNPGCPPLKINFNGLTNFSNVSYGWDFNGDGMVDDTGQTSVHTYDSSGIYSVSLIITSSAGCSKISSVPNSIQVYPSPNAGFDHSPEVGSLLNPDIDFTSDGLTTGATGFAWNFGDGNDTAGIANPIHLYNDTGTFIVTLITTNQFGCKDTAIDTVIIDSEFAIFVPNAYTPDANGKNDIFIAKGVGIDLKNYVMYIFDRWGDQIFETHDLYKGWDGHANGGAEMVQQDVYVWMIICYDLHQNKHRLIGHVTVVK